MRITTKVSIITAIILIVIITVQTINASFSLNNMITLLKETDESAQQVSVSNEFESKFELLAVSIIPIIKDPEILQAFANRDREALAKRTLPMMDELKAQGVKQFHFHLPNATSFFRVQSPDEFGDDLSAFRQTVVQANDTKKIIEGLEGGVSGAGFRYVVPLSYNNKHIGTVELGLGLEDDFLLKMKEDYGGEWMLYGLENNQAAFMFGTKEEQPLTLSADDLSTIIKGNPVNLLEDTTKISAFPLTDFSGDVKWFLVSKKDYSDAIAKESSAKRNLLLSSIVVSIIGLAIIIVFLRRLLNPLSHISKNAESIAQGDLTVAPLPFQSKDEIGTLSTSFNKMTESLKSLIYAVQLKSNELSQNANTISDNLVEGKEETNKIVQSIIAINNDAQQSMHASDETAKAMSEISQGIVRVADNTTNIANSSKTINEVTGEGNEVVHSAVHQMEIIEERTGQFATIISELKVDSNEIGSIMQLITGIAEQTNLLALNAAIEAARAGEAGKGFAVVADEIRRLADQTTNSASKVHDLINEIQSKTETAVKAMDLSKSEVQEGTGRIHTVGTLFIKIQEAIRDLNTDIDELSALSEEMSAGTEEVTAAVHEIANSSIHSAEFAKNVATASEEQLDNMEEISQSTQTLSEMSKELEKCINTFKI